MAKPLQVAPGLAVAATAVAASALSGCGHVGQYALSDRDCLARVMYFESNRSSQDGMLAVGTVVMNRLGSPAYPKSVCGVVGQRNQFADGALSKPAGGRSLALAYGVADRVLAGERHDEVGSAMFFHTAGYTFPYRNMAYVTAAGGNVFYEKRTPGTFNPIHPSRLVSREDRAKQERTAPVRMAAASREEDEEPAPPARHPARPGRHASAAPVPEAHGAPPPSLSDLIELDMGHPRRRP